MVLRKFIFLLFLVLFLWLPKPLYAADFSFDYDINYAVNTNGRTVVTQEITVTNNTTEYYAQNFSLILQSERLESITAHDAAGTIVPEIEKKDGQTTITVPFNVKVVGLGEKFPFTLSYVTTDIAEKKGTIWEIIIPGIEYKEEISSYNVRLAVPPAFGRPAYLVPPPAGGNTWTLDQLRHRGVTAAYGEVQQFTFNLVYHLENLSGKTELQEITLPPETAYQKPVLNRLSILPENVRIDADGNWLAEYKLAPKEKKRIVADGTVFIYATPQRGYEHTLTAQEKQLYTTPQTYWEADAAMIAKARELKTAQAIYDYVVETLTYDYTRIEKGITRLGAQTVFATPSSAVCMEFSDLFVALARAAGIPAREIHGYAYTTNSRLQPLSLSGDVLHAWAEYYDESRRQWISIDPTWGNTTNGIDYFSKFDFNHIAFAILGSESNYPYPAGSFKGDTDGKDVFVDFVREPVVLTDPTYKTHITARGVVGTTVSGVVTVENMGTTLGTPQVVLVSDYQVKLLGDSPKVTPYGKIELPFSLVTPFALQRLEVPIQVEVNGKTSSHTVELLPFYEVYWPYLLLMLAVFGIVGRYVIRRKKTKTAPRPSGNLQIPKSK